VAVNIRNRKAQAKPRRVKGRSAAERRERVVRLLERDIWPTIPREHLGRRPSQAEEDAILGYIPRA
jgi:hypothetical protein